MIAIHARHLPEAITAAVIFGDSSERFITTIGSGVGQIPNKEALLGFRKAIDRTLLLSEAGVAQYNDQVRQDDMEREYAARAAWKKQRPKSLTCVYLMLNQKTGLIKIGVSKKPKAREGTLQSEDPGVQLLFATPPIYTVKHEQQLHSRYQAKRIRGEWFKLTNEDITEIRTLLNPTP